MIDGMTNAITEVVFTVVIVLGRIYTGRVRFGASLARVRIEDSSRNRFALNGIQGIE